MSAMPNWCKDYRPTSLLQVILYMVQNELGMLFCPTLNSVVQNELGMLFCPTLNSVVHNELGMLFCPTLNRLCSLNDWYLYIVFLKPESKIQTTPSLPFTLKF